jgi:anti-anti-sigma factor
LGTNEAVREHACCEEDPVDSAQIRARIERQYVMLRASSDLDAAGAAPILRELDTIESSTDVVVDMSDVSRCTDDGWQVLSRATQRLNDADGSLTLSCLRPEVRAQLRSSGYADQLKVRRRGR